MKQPASLAGVVLSLMLLCVPPSTGEDLVAVLDPAADTEQKVAVCAGCHGPNGHSAVPDNPILAAQHPAYLRNALQAYISGARDYGIMKTMAERLSAADIEEIAAYYAAQPPARSRARAAGDAAAGRGKTAVCAGCHGQRGQSVIPINPSLAGQHATYLARALKAYRTGSRSNPTMASMVLALSDQDIEDIAAYYAAQPRQSLAIAGLPRQIQERVQ